LKKIRWSIKEYEYFDKPKMPSLESNSNSLVSKQYLVKTQAPWENTIIYFPLNHFGNGNKNLEIKVLDFFK
jgi:hypothetical protein